MPQCHSKVSGTGASNNKPSVMIYLQGCILSEFPIIMEKGSGYVVVPFREIMTSHIEAVSQSEFIFAFKCAQEFLKVITFSDFFNSCSLSLILINSPVEKSMRMMYLGSIRLYQRQSSFIKNPGVDNLSA